MNREDGEQKHVVRSRELEQRFSKSGCCFWRVESPVQILNSLHLIGLVGLPSCVRDDASIQSGWRRLNSVPNYYFVSWKIFHHEQLATPNDPKLSDCGVRRGTCMVGGKAAVEAGAVTHGAVRCSAWLGVISLCVRA